jgi:integrase
VRRFRADGLDELVHADETVTFPAMLPQRRGQLSYWNVRYRGFEPARAAAGLPESVTWHSLRKAAASLYADAGLTDEELASTMGHSDATVTRRFYSRTFDRAGLNTKVRAAQEKVA